MNNPSEATLRAARKIGHFLRLDCCGHDTNEREVLRIATIIDEELAEETAKEIQPKTQCPKCGHWQDDFDGFGVLFCEECKYCSHPSSIDNACEICGKRGVHE